MVGQAIAIPEGAFREFARAAFASKDEAYLCDFHYGVPPA